MSKSFFSVVWDDHNTAVLTGLIILIFGLVTNQYINQQKPNLPIAKLIPGDISTSLMQARSLYPDTPFILPLKPAWVILPHSLMTEIRGMPEDKISFKQHTFEKFLGKYTGIGSTEHPEAINAIKFDLTRNIGKILADLQEEVGFLFHREIGPCNEWKQITVYPTVVQIVAGLSARAFVGLPLCRDKEWTQATMDFTRNAIVLMHMNSIIPLVLRPYLSPLLPAFRKLSGFRTFAGNKLMPQVTQILNTYKGQLRDFKSLSDDRSLEQAEKNNFNLIHWMIGHFKDPEQADAFELGQQQMTAAFAAIHTSGMAASHAIFDLAAYPECIATLRKEIEGVIDEEGFADRQLRKSSMTKLKKLDSFIKESARMSPPTIVAMNRVVTSPSGIDLSTGHHLPNRTVVGFGHPFYPTSTEPRDHLLRKKGQPSLEEFHPFRFADIRAQQPGQENSFLFVSSDPNNINFGYGRNVCPGRFFASNEVKVILIELLMKYDIGLGPDGGGIQAGFVRPKIQEFGPNYMPDMKASVWLKERKVQV